MMVNMLVGSVEAGGTKFVCAVGNEKYEIIDRHCFPTTTPQETLAKVISYFKKFDITCLGVASFGPLNLNRDSDNFGYITTSPKLGWQNVSLYSNLKRALDVPIHLTTDVNGSAYGEYVASKKAGSQLDSLVYYTIGTGVGAGVIYGDRFIGDLGNPEMGHVTVKRHQDDHNFAGICPYHKDCLEGLVAGPTFEARLGKRGQDVPASNHVWNIMAYYVAQALIQATMTFRPGKIVLGGGVMNRSFLAEIKEWFIKLLAGYVNVPSIDEYVTMPIIENNGSAIIGNFVLAANMLNKL